MCGIVGIIRPHGLLRDEGDRIIHQMRDTLAHRGPDDATCEVHDSWVALGHRRLSIIDIEGSRQPLRSEDGNIVAIFNGEIYNFRALRSQLEKSGHRFTTEGDGETIVHGYEQWGLSLLDRLEGMFAFILLDRLPGKVVVGRDRAGIKPIFWSEQAGAVLVGSELKALFAHPDLRPRASRRGLVCGLSRMHVPWPLTAFAGVFRLPPGATLVIERDGRRSLNRFAYPPEAPAGSIPDPVAATHVALRAAVARQMVADVSVGAFLSGGIDSTLIVALMRELGVSPLHTFSMGVNRPGDDESDVARRTARRLGTLHHEVRLEELRFCDFEALPRMFDEPFAEFSAIGVHLLSSFARAHVKVALSGDGGDEVFGGYRTYRWVRAATTARRVLGRRLALALSRRASLALAGHQRSASVRRGLRFALLLGLEPAAAHRSLTTFAWAESAPERRVDEEVSHRLTSASWRGAPDEALRSAMNSDWLERLPNAMMAKVDIASMQASLEVRVPMLDDVLVRFAQDLDDRDLVSARWGKLVLRRLLEKLLPDGPAWHHKRGFVLPIDQWMRADPVRGQFRQLLGDNARSLRRLQGVDTSEEWRAFEQGTSRWSVAATAMRLMWLGSVALWAQRFQPESPTEDEPFPPFV